MDLRGLEDWFFNNTKRISTQGQGAYWTLKRDHGRVVYTNLEVSDPQESYRMLCDYIENQATNGAREFEVWFKLSKTDPSKANFLIRVPYGMTGISAGQAGMGINGLPVPASQPAIGQLMEQRMSERLDAQKKEYELKIERLKEQHENDQKFRDLEEQLSTIAESKKSRFDKLLERLEEQPQLMEKLMDTLAPGIRGVLMQMFPKVSVAGVQTMNEVPEQPLDLTGGSPIPENMNTRGEAEQESQGGIDFNPAIQSLLNLYQAGFTDAAGDIQRLSDAAVQLAQADGFKEDPVGIIEKVVNFVTSNPAQAKMLLNQL